MVVFVLEFLELKKIMNAKRFVYQVNKHAIDRGQ